MLAAPAVAQPAPAPWAGWEREPLPRSPHPDTPVDLPREAEGAFQSQLADLIASQKWEVVAAQLVARARNRSLQGRVLDRAGALPVGVAPAAIEQLRRWPEARQAAARAGREELEELLRAPQDPRAARIAALNRFPFADRAAALAGRLGDEALEAGRCEEAAAWWRRAQHLAMTPALASRAARRLLWLRARASRGAIVTGRLGPIARVGAPRLRWVRDLSGAIPGRPPRRQLASDAEALYTSSQGRLLALARADGRVRWAVEAPGLGGAVLAVGARDLVLARGGRLEGRATTNGAAVWSVELELEAVSDLQPWGQGWIVLGVRDGHWRCLGLGPRGALRWDTRLWEHELPLLRPIQRGRPGRALPAGPVRRVRGDGRLSLLADGCAVTAAGRVALLGAQEGELRWARQRLFGLGLGANGPVDVQIHLGAFELWAMTATGLLVRLDPTRGASLPLAPVPIGPKGPQDGYLVNALPPIWIWRDGRFGGVDWAPSAPLSAGPIWSGASAKGWLALPRGDGLELRRGAERRRLAWPNRPGEVRSLGDAWVVCDEEGIALVDWSQPGREAAPAPKRPPVGAVRVLRALGHPSWRVRRAARASLGSKNLPALRAALAQARLSPQARSEARFVVEGLVEAEARRARWAKIAPGVDFRRVELARADVSGRRLRELRKSVQPGAEAARGLRREVDALQSLDQRRAFLELYLRAEPRFEGRLVALSRTSSAGIQQAAADLLVRVAQGGGSKRGLRLLIRRQSIPAIRALARTRDQKLWEEIAPEDLRGLKLNQIGLPFGAGGERDHEGLWEALLPVLRAP
jgi:hypothetical protein